MEMKQEVILAGSRSGKQILLFLGGFLGGFWSLSSESASDQVSLESGLAALHDCALGNFFFCLFFCVLDVLIGCAVSIQF